MYWPIVQTINFGFVPARNQVMFVSFFSMVWSTFMAYIQHLEVERLRKQPPTPTTPTAKVKKPKAVMVK